jgi:hypothetical protein
MGAKVPTWITVLVVLVLAVLAGFRLQARVNLPEHLLGHPATTLPDFLDSDTADELVALMKVGLLGCSLFDVVPELSRCSHFVPPTTDCWLLLSSSPLSPTSHL